MGQRLNIQWGDHAVTTIHSCLNMASVKLAAMLAEKYPNTRLHVHAIQNDFFGPGVTVTGLLTGRDIIAQCKGKLRSGRLLLPEDTLRAEGDLLLDDTTPADLAAALGAQVQVVPKGGDALLDAVLYGEDATDAEDE